LTKRQKLARYYIDCFRDVFVVIRSLKVSTYAYTRFGEKNVNLNIKREQQLRRYCDGVTKIKRNCWTSIRAFVVI